MQIEPPSLAAKLEREGKLPWREAARIMAEIARQLDRLHARGRVHGGIEPLAVLFVGGAVRLADPVSPGTGEPARGALDAAGNDRRDDFASLGRTFAAMLGGAGAIESLPSTMRDIVERCGAADPAFGFRSGNGIAEAIELTLASEEPEEAGAPPAEPTGKPGAPPAPAASPAAVPFPLPRRRRADPRPLLALLGFVLLIGGAAIYVLRPAPPAPTAKAPPGGEPEAPAREPVPEKDVLVELLAPLPDQPVPVMPEPPEVDAVLRRILASGEGRSCRRLEVERVASDLRLVGRTASVADREAIMAELDGLEDVVDVAIEVDRSGRFCRLYDILDARTERTLPRLADLYPRRTDHRLVEGEPLVILARVPGEPVHLTVDYFTADDMVVHLRRPDPGEPALSPFDEVLVGNPLDEPALQITAPFGDELVLVLASPAPLLATPRPAVEEAGAYLDALEGALGDRAPSVLASVLPVTTVPAAP